MSTFTDGAPPSVSPGPDDHSGPDENPPQAAPAAGVNRAEGSDWLRAEIQRRIAAKSADGGGARHARRGGASASKGIGYVPRHSVGPAPAPIAPPAAPPATPRPSPTRRPDAPPTKGFPAVAPAPVPPAAETGPVPQLSSDGVPPAPVGKASGQPTGPNAVVVPLHTAAATDQATPVGPPVTNLVPPTTRAGAPNRPVPPAGPAVARLLSPPSTPPATPTGIPLEPAADATPPVAPTPPRIGPRPTASPELEASGEVIWSSLTPPDAGLGAGRKVALPTQRGTEPQPADTETATGGISVVAGAAPARSEAEHGSEPGSEPVEEPIKRVRVVLAERKTIARPVRTVVDVQEGTGVGEVLRRNLIRGQLRVALAFAACAVLTLGLLPVAFAFLPEIGRFEVLGIRLPWLLLGVLVYPFLLGLGWWHTRTAERVEQNFADHVQD